MEKTEPKKLSKKGLREAQKRFQEWCKKPLPSEVIDLIREATKDQPPIKRKKNERAAKGRSEKDADV